MKRQITISIVVVLGVIAMSLMSFEATAQARKERVISADTGIITLGPNQLLRIVTNNKDPDSLYAVSFTQMSYARTATGGGSRYTLVSQTTSDSTTVPAGEGFSIDIGTSEAVRGVISTSSQEVLVTAQIIDGTTGNIIAVLIGL